jgi:Ca-activated chloride channel family protein
MYFDQPIYLLGLLLIPLLIYIRFLWLKRKPGTVYYSNVNTVKKIPKGLWARLHRIPDVLRILAIALLVIAVARPQSSDTDIIETRGVDILICLDASRSMNAIDMSLSELEHLQLMGRAPSNRFQIAVDVLRQFISTRKGDRVGLILFGRKSYLKFPLTLDYARVLNDMDAIILDDFSVGPDGECANGCTISGAGTVIGEALARAYKRVKSSTAPMKNIILITDGESQGDSIDALSMAKYMANRPEEEGKYRIFTFLIGKEGQAYRIAGTDYYGRTTYAEVPFGVNPKLLKEIAETTGGQFYRSEDESQFRKDFSNLQRTYFSSPIRFGKKELYMYFLTAAFMLILLEFLLRFTAFRKFP